MMVSPLTTARHKQPKCFSNGGKSCSSLAQVYGGVLSCQPRPFWQRYCGSLKHGTRHRDNENISKAGLLVCSLVHAASNEDHRKTQQAPGEGCTDLDTYTSKSTVVASTCFGEQNCMGSLDTWPVCHAVLQISRCAPDTLHGGVACSVGAASNIHAASTYGDGSNNWSISMERPTLYLSTKMWDGWHELQLATNGDSCVRLLRSLGKVYKEGMPFICLGKWWFELSALRTPFQMRLRLPFTVRTSDHIAA